MKTDDKIVKLQTDYIFIYGWAEAAVGGGDRVHNYGKVFERWEIWKTYTE